jgi:hypothetical protein
MDPKTKFISWIKDLMKDERGAASVKPVIAVIGTLFLCGSLVYSLISKTPVTFSDVIINAIVIVTLAGMTGDTVDKFSVKGVFKPKESKDEPTEGPKIS